MDKKEKSIGRERFVVMLSAALILTALTVLGLFMNRANSDGEQEYNHTLELEQNLLQGGQVPELEDITDLKIVDSGTVENPGRTGNGTTIKKNATNTSNDLVAKGTELIELDQETMLSEMAESIMLSFDGSQMIWPMDGEKDILIPYSMDQAVYFKTLEQYKYNPAIIMKAEVGEEVRAVSAGKITRKYWDYEIGWTYEMDLGGGFKAYYGQLDGMQKEEDTYVAAGDVIGYVAEPTKYYVEEGSNLYFAMTKENKPVYPMDYLGE